MSEKPPSRTPASIDDLVDLVALTWTRHYLTEEALPGPRGELYRHSGDFRSLPTAPCTSGARQHASAPRLALQYHDLLAQTRFHDRSPNGPLRPGDYARCACMRRILLLLVCQFGLLAGSRLLADVVTMKDGRQISGLVESGNIQELHMKAGEQSQTIDIHEVQAIQFGVSLPAPAATPAAKVADLAPAAPEPAPAQPNSLILNDGTHVSGRWWSIDATTMHFLVNNQLQHYPRADVLGVTFGSATLPPLPARSTAPPATSAQPPASAAQPARAPTLARSSPSPPPQPPTLTQPSGSAPPAAPPRGLSQPEEIGMVYFWKSRVLTPLEHNQAVEHKSRSAQYFEMPGPKSRVRVNEASSLAFVVRLPQGVDPASYSLFDLATVSGSRRTRPRPGPRGGLVTWPVDIEVNDQSSLITYVLTVRDLPPGEYSFSPSSSNDGYCFGVDPSGSGQ